MRRRFRLDDDDLDRLASWVEAAAIRWGLDAEHRAGWGLDLDANTWARGLRRVLVGAAVSGEDHRVVADVLPLDDVGDGDLELVGAAVELVDRLHAFVTAAAEATDGAAWAAALRAALAGLTSTTPEDAWQAAQVERELARLTGERAGEAPRGTGRAALRHADVRALLRRRLRGRPTRANFRTGTLTVCTMVPMRSVPHRVVCLVGLDDDVFPRSPTPDGDDVLARRPRTGERDARAEDRQLLLDAIGAATEKLVVTYTGRGVHTGQQRPPAVPLGELLDAVDRTAAAPPGAQGVRGLVVREHPLQPHDESVMRPGEQRRREPFTFDAAAVAGAVAARDAAPREPLLVPVPLPPLPREDVALADLHEFLAHPVRAFLRGRLRVGTGREHEELGAAVPLELDNLETWQVGDRLLRDVLAGASPQAGMRAEQLRGALPPGRLGVRVLDGVKDDVRGLVEKAAPLREGEPRALDVDVRLRDGRRLTGTVSDLYGSGLVRVSFSRLGAKHRLAAWLDALALAAGHPDESITAHTVGKHRTGAQRALLPPLDHRAADWLSDLVDLWDAAMTEPVPLPLKTGLAWAEEWCLAREGRHVDPDEKAAREWTTPRFNDSGFPREDDDRWHALAFGDRAPYERLACGARDGDPGCEPAGSGLPDPPHRLGRFAWALWRPLLTESGEQVRAL